MMKNIELLLQPIERGLHNYAFIDRIFYDQTGKLFPVLEVVTPALQAQSHLYPYLLLLNELDDNSWVALNEKIAAQVELSSEPLLCSAFFTSDLMPESLCQILAEQLLKNYDDKYYILRYYDPRVMCHLLWMFSDEEWQGFYQETRCHSWSLYLNNGWYSFEIKGNDKEKVGNNKNSNKDALFNIGEINSVLAVLPKENDLNKYIQLSQKVNAYLLRAKTRYGFTNVQDRITFALHCVTHGEYFDDTPFMVRSIREIRQREVGYTTFTGNFSSSDWLLIKEQLIHECVKERI